MGWTWVILIADAIGVSWGVIFTLLDKSVGDDDPGFRWALREVRLAEIATDGVLFALIAIAIRRLGLGGFATLAWFALSAGRAYRMAKGFGFLHNPTARSLQPKAAAYAVFSALVVVVVSLTHLGSGHVATAADRDSALFGVKVLDHDTAPSRLVGYRPSLADTDVSGAAAVPVERYQLNGQLLTLLVHHDLTCRLDEVLLGQDGPDIDVVVVYSPTFMTRTTPAEPGPSASPGPAPPGTCEATPDTVFIAYTAIEIGLPEELTGDRIDDVGAAGPAIAVSATP